MVDISTLARKFKVEVALGSESPDTAVWIPLRGIQELNPAKEDNLEDDSDYDSDGWSSSVRTGQSWSLEVTVARKQNSATTAYDPGQELIRAASDQFGVDGTVLVRWFNRDGGDEAYSGTAQAGFTDSGGSTTALSTASITLTGVGKRNRIVNPAVIVEDWAATTAYAIDDQVDVTGGTLKATAAGTSGTVEPVLPGAVGGTVVDGTVTWERTV